MEDDILTLPMKVESRNVLDRSIGQLKENLRRYGPYLLGIR